MSLGLVERTFSMCSRAVMVAEVMGDFARPQHARWPVRGTVRMRSPPPPKFSGLSEQTCTSPASFVLTAVFSYRLSDRRLVPGIPFPRGRDDAHVTEPGILGVCSDQKWVDFFQSFQNPVALMHKDVGYSDICNSEKPQKASGRRIWALWQELWRAQRVHYSVF